MVKKINQKLSKGKRKVGDGQQSGDFVLLVDNDPLDPIDQEQQIDLEKPEEVVETIVDPQDANAQFSPIRDAIRDTTRESTDEPMQSTLNKMRQQGDIKDPAKTYIIRKIFKKSKTKYTPRSLKEQHIAKLKEKLENLSQEIE